MAKQPGLDGRHRDQSGETSKKKGNTRVDTLRKTYGETFAEGYRGDMHLRTLLERENVESLDQLLKRKR
jgi:hypothetical protein